VLKINKRTWSWKIIGSGNVRDEGRGVEKGKGDNLKGGEEEITRICKAGGDKREEERGRKMRIGRAPGKRSFTRARADTEKFLVAATDRMFRRTVALSMAGGVQACLHARAKLALPPLQDSR